MAPRDGPSRAKRHAPPLREVPEIASPEARWRHYLADLVAEPTDAAYDELSDDETNELMERIAELAYAASGDTT